MEYYSIKEVSDLLGISIYTLRYYEKIGILDHVKRDAQGRRLFSQSDVLVLNTVECLKRTGMTLKQIKHYVDLVAEGLPSAGERLEMFTDQPKTVDQQLAELAACTEPVDGTVRVYQGAGKHGRLDVCHDERDALVQKIFSKNRKKSLRLSILEHL